MKARFALAALLTACAGAHAPLVSPTSDGPGLGGAVRPEMGSPQPGDMAPALELVDLDGKSVSLGAMRGSWVVLHFTATWCAFCDSEVSHLGALAEAFASWPVKTVLVDVEEDAKSWASYAATHVAPAVMALRDSSGAAVARFAPPGAQPSFDDRAQAVLDATLIVDPSGRIRLFLLPDSAHFDPTFRAVRAELERIVPPPVVAVSVAPCTARAGARAEIVVTLTMARGFHVMSDRPSAPTYIPTRVTLEGVSGASLGEPRYPAPASFPLGDGRIATFEGTIDIHVPIEIASDAAAGPRRVRGSLRYQACTESRCLFPVTQPFVAQILIAPRQG